MDATQTHNEEFDKFLNSTSLHVDDLVECKLFQGYYFKYRLPCQIGDVIELKVEEVFSSKPIVLPKKWKGIVRMSLHDFRNASISNSEYDRAKLRLSHKWKAKLLDLLEFCRLLPKSNRTLYLK